MNVTANGKNFQFPDGTSTDDIGAAIDEYFAGQSTQQGNDNPSPQTSAGNQQPNQPQPQDTSPYAQGMISTNTQLSQSRDADTSNAQGFRDRVIDSVTGASRMTPEMESLKSLDSSPEANQLNSQALKLGFSQLFGSDSSQEKVLQGMGATLRKDEKGNTIVSLPSGDYALNKPGLSPQDVTSFIANALAFTPAARAPSVIGSMLKSAATDTAIQVANQVAGGDQYNPVQTAEAGVIGGIGKGAENLLSGTARAIAGKASPENQAAVDFANQNNLPLMTSDVVPPQTFTGRSAQAAAEKIPVVGTGSLRRDQQNARSQLIQDYASSFGQASPDDIVQSLKNQVSKVKQAAGQRLSDVDSAMSSVGTIQPTQTLSAIDGAISNLSRLGKAADTQTISKLQSYRDELANGADFGLLRDFRTQFRQDVKGDRTSWPNKSEALVNRVYQAMTGDINKSVSDNLGSQTAYKYQQANAAYANQAQQVNNTRLKSILQKGDLTPEVANNLLFSSKPSEVKALYSSLDQTGRSSARAAVVGKAFEKSGGSPDKFLNELNRMSSQTGILFKGEDRQYLNGVTNYLDQTRRAARAGAVTPTGQELLQFGAPTAAAADLLHNGGVGTLSFGAFGLLSRAYESKPFRSAMIRLANTPKGSTAYDRHISNASQALTTIAQAGKQE
ncbi:injection protein [Rosenbergiella nectarea]|uniref:injection protein n=1 Tax=Rosenbergiella nectarea TaxID=988801 RepID=UPI001BD9F33C|nr:injection protein [Rosenbergiella nectarea]MBT0729511.1 injection protein [Rosenbergiella nectarea subsp. apis]